MKPAAGWESKLLRVQPPAATVSAFEAAYRALQAAEDKAAKAMQAQYSVGSWLTYKASGTTTKTSSSDTTGENVDTTA